MHGTLSATPPKRSPYRSRLPLLLRLAFRELRAGLKGFGIFLACIALGVAAIAGVSSISRSLTEGLGKEGRKILGADVTFGLFHREASEAERALGELPDSGHGFAPVPFVGPPVAMPQAWSRRIAAERGIPSQVAVEESMACGIGVCMTCVLPVVGDDGLTRMVRSCVEGPVFLGDRVRWDAL